jgi:RNA polymerase sigma-54 factor
MALEQRLSLKLSQRLVMTPSLQQAIKMLQMTRLELCEAVNQEVVENPVLEDATDEENQEVAPAEPPSTELSDRPAASDAPAPASPESEPTKDSFDEIDYESYFQEYVDSGYDPRQREEREETPLENTLIQEPGLSEYLTWQLGMSSAKNGVRDAAGFIIGNLDEDGYLRVSRHEIAEAGAWSPVEIDAALEIVRSFDPPGICAFDLPDCLLRQVRMLGLENALLEDILTKHWKPFLNRQFAALSRELNVPMGELQAVLDVVKNLETKPGRRFSAERTVYVQPDVIVRKVDGDYVVLLEEDGLPRLRISGAYRRMLQGQNGGLNVEAKEYLRERMRSAVWLIKSLDQRQRTIYKVAESIVSHQKEFFEKGIEYLRPLVLRDVANDIGMHESTVSRVVSNKYMQTPRGILPMKYFFHTGIDSSAGEDVSSVSIKNKISRMISEEDPKRPFSDAKIMQRLQAEGIQIARRTVAKYREELRIASSSQRKAIF